jgi:type VI secretion system secreted protein VgrG
LHRPKEEGIIKISKRVLLVLLVAVFVFGLALIARAATSVNLGTADSFAVLGGLGITNTGPSVINGDVGTYPTTTETGFSSVTLNGTDHAGDATTQGAKTNLTTAYNDAAGQASDANLSGQDLGGMTLTPGTYTFNSSAQLTGTLTLNGQGNADAVFIFQIGSALTTASSSKVILENSAQACHVFWQIGSSATLGTSTDFEGNIIALTSITLNTNANIEGSALARNGAVTLDTNTITTAACLVPVIPVIPPAPTNPAPLINITKVPTPLASLGATLVTYDYTVTNVGTVPMSSVAVTDNKCANVNYVSGDTNGDSKLDLAETWHYNCTTMVSKTTTNTATATGAANGFTATDTANATVVIGSLSPAPIIHLIKTPNTFLLASSGGAVTYTYTVTNPGTVALSHVSVVQPVIPTAIICLRLQRHGFIPVRRI